jgi:hypothetical protein
MGWGEAAPKALKNFSLLSRPSHLENFPFVSRLDTKSRLSAGEILTLE